MGPPIFKAWRIQADGQFVPDGQVDAAADTEVVAVSGEVEAFYRMLPLIHQLIETTPGTWFQEAWGWSNTKH